MQETEGTDEILHHMGEPQGVDENLHHMADTLSALLKLSSYSLV